MGFRVEIHDPSPESGAGALFGFFTLSAKERKELGEERVLKLVEEQLIRLFGGGHLEGALQAVDRAVFELMDRMNSHS